MLKLLNAFDIKIVATTLVAALMIVIGGAFAQAALAPKSVGCAFAEGTATCQQQIVTLHEENVSVQMPGGYIQFEGSLLIISGAGNPIMSEIRGGGIGDLAALLLDPLLGGQVTIESNCVSPLDNQICLLNDLDFTLDGENDSVWLMQRAGSQYWIPLAVNEGGVAVPTPTPTATPLTPTPTSTSECPDGPGCSPTPTATPPTPTATPPTPTPTATDTPVPSGAVVFDSASSATSGGVLVTSLSWNHTASGTDRLVVVYWGSYGSDSNFVATYGGNTMTELPDTPAGQIGANLEGWYLINPPTGSQQISITWNGTEKAVAGAISVTGANQTSPIDNTAFATGVGTNPSVTIVSATDNLVIDMVVHKRADTLTVDAGQTERWQENADPSLLRLRGSSSEDGAASVVMSWTADKSKEWVMHAVSIQP